MHSVKLRPRRLVLLMLIACATVQAEQLRTNIPDDPAQIEPITQSELIASDVIRHMYEGFTALDPQGELIPALAVDWQAHDDNLGFRFHLREGVKFHSGRTFTAADVKFTFEQLLLPENRGGAHTRYLRNVVGASAMRNGETSELVGVRVVDRHTVDVRFTKPDVLFPMYPLSFIDRRAIESGDVLSLRERSAGTGPFRLESWRRGREVVLARHDEYWGGRPALSEVVFLIVPNAHTAISMYEADELDLFFADQTTIRRVMRDSAFDGQRMRVTAAQIQYLGMNQNLYIPFRDIRIREAVCRTLDRKAMVEGLHAGAAAPLYGQTAPHVAGYNPDVVPIEYDPARARELLADAGYPGGRGLPPVNVTGTFPNKDELVYIASQLRQELGFPVEVEIMERGSYIMNLNAGYIAFFPWGWAADYSDAMYFLGQVWHGSSVYNRSRWQNSRFDALIDRARETLDDSKRFELYRRAENILLDDWGTCPTTVKEQVVLKKDYVWGVQLTPQRFLPFDDVRIER